MKKHHLLLVAVLTLELMIFSYQKASALYSDTGNSANNTFTASDVFPSATPTITPTPTDTPTPTPTNTPTPTPTPEIPSQEVVINELMWTGSFLSTNDEWIELRNMTANPINLSGWKLIGAAPSSTEITISSGTLAGNSYFLISNFDENSVSSVLAITPDVVTTVVQLDNIDAQVILRNASNALIDIADDSSGSPLAGNNGIKSSMERNLVPGDGTLGSNWHTATTTLNLDFGATESATPKSANSL